MTKPNAPTEAVQPALREALQELIAEVEHWIGVEYAPYRHTHAIRVKLDNARAALKATDAPLVVPASELLPDQIRLTRDADGLCIVSIDVDGDWRDVIRDAGDVISHYVTLGDAMTAIAPTRDELAKELAEANETIANLVRALREETESPTFMGEPVIPVRAVLKAAQPVPVQAADYSFRQALKAAPEPAAARQWDRRLSTLTAQHASHAVQLIADAWNNLDPEHRIAVEYSDLFDRIAEAAAMRPNNDPAELYEHFLTWQAGRESMTLEPVALDVIFELAEEYGKCWVKAGETKEPLHVQHLNDARYCLREAIKRAQSPAAQPEAQRNAMIEEHGLIDAQIERDEAKAALKAAQPVPLCMCKDRPLSDCPGEWEPGCDLGANEKYVRQS
jgi:hypothetical protein